MANIMQSVRIKSNLPKDELLRIANERKPQFEALQGLLQKYYVEYGPGEYGGVYIWDSMESLQAFKTSELAGSIAAAYQATEPPTITISEVMFQLRN